MSKTMKLSICKGDMVQVISGRDKGKTGNILVVDAKNLRVKVEKINLAKRHVRPSQENPAGGVVEKEAWIHYSNVLLFSPKANKGVRHSIKAGAGKDAKKQRIHLKTGEVLGQA